jgi:hypothetical protein
VLAPHRLQEQQLLQQQPPQQLQQGLSMQFNPIASSSSSSSTLSHGLQGRSTLAVLTQQGLQHCLQAVLQAGPAAAAAACRLQERRLQETTRLAFLQSLQEGRLSICW